MANYYIIDKSIMPTRGELYPEDAVIKARPLSIADVKFISSIEDFNATIVINEIVERCCKFENMKITDLYLADRDFIIFWLRANSFVSSSGYRIDIDHCPYCDMAMQKNIKLEDFDVDYLTTFNEDVTLSNGVVVHFQLPKIRDKRIIPEDRQVELILKYSNIAKLLGTDDPEELQFIILNNISAMDFSLLLSTAEQMRCGIKETLYTACDNCHNRLPLNMQISESALFGKMDLLDILRIELYTCKYCGFQVNEDTPYTEVEMMQKIIQEMQQKEREEMDKQRQGMHMPSMPNISSLKNMTNRLRH